MKREPAALNLRDSTAREAGIMERSKDMLVHSPGEGQLYLRLETVLKGVKECLGPPSPAIVIHVGHSMHLACDLAGRHPRGRRVHGDINIIPAGLPSRWETTESYGELSIRVPDEVIHEIARRFEE
jgi:hypothetical protein